jgi:hypothetical protein
MLNKLLLIANALFHQEFESSIIRIIYISEIFLLNSFTKTLFLNLFFFYYLPVRRIENNKRMEGG